MPFITEAFRLGRVRPKESLVANGTGPDPANKSYYETPSQGSGDGLAAARGPSPAILRDRAEKRGADVGGAIPSCDVQTFFCLETRKGAILLLPESSEYEPDHLESACVCVVGMEQLALAL